MMDICIKNLIFQQNDEYIHHFKRKNGPPEKQNGGIAPANTHNVLSQRVYNSAATPGLVDGLLPSGTTIITKPHITSRPANTDTDFLTIHPSCG
jgi:hypothetical protein